jgi:peptidoglycan/xylan/chitin deacetylase (PgdA/CDA1 family)
MKSTVIISYDDGVTEDYTLAYPVHRCYGVPAEVCVPSSYVGSEGRLTRDQLMELQSAGWEIVSHTKHHVSLADEVLKRSARRGDSKLYLSGHLKFKPGVQLSVSQGKNTEHVTVTDRGNDRNGNYIVVDREIRNHYTGTGNSRVLQIIRRLSKLKYPHAIVSVSDEQAYTEIQRSRQELENLGFRIRHFTYPYNRYSGRTRELVSRWYESARAGSRNASDSTKSDRYALRSINFERNKINDDKLMEILGETKTRNELCFLHAHTFSEEFSVDRLENIINYCLSNGIDISTRSEYFSRP